jgi:hypothetical protein
MKNFLISLNIVIWSFIGYQVTAYAAETKRICTTQKDAKTGKDKEVCKNVKVHKKHEGTKVPEKAPAKKPAAKPEQKK